MAHPAGLIRCPQCDAEAGEGARFCAQCGTKLAGSCAHCGAALPPDARFCSACGAPVGLSAPEAGASPLQAGDLMRLVPKEYAQRLAAAGAAPSPERRLVTILFCDVKGSTATAEHLDPEDVLEIMNGAFQVLIPPVYEHEGTLARLMGDAILAFFGAPMAHEDDPERAIRAALDIMAGVRLYADRLAREQGIPGFAVRVGIHTGLVVVGEVGSDLRVEYTAMGDAVNLAARLEQAADPGTILISAATHRQVRGLFQCEPVAPLTLKGRSDQVAAFRVLAARPRAFRSPTRGVEGIETRMVGRDAEIRALQDAFLAAAQTRERQLITVVGEAGLGKSRLLFEFERWLKGQPAPVRVLRARAGQDLQGVPYGLFRSLFALYLGLGDSDPSDAVRQRFEAEFHSLLGRGEESRMKAHFVAHLLGYDLPGSPHAQEFAGDQRQVRDRAVFYVTELLSAATGETSVVLLLEDIHWADDSSLDVLLRLARDLPDRPWLAVSAARPALFERRPDWGQGSPSHGRVELQSLSRQASQDLVDDILQRVDHAPDVLRELIVGGADGNPFFLEELIKMLVDEGVIIIAEERWQIEPTRLAKARVPASLTGVLQARLDRLPQEERATLQRASVVGRVFWDHAIAYVAEHATPGHQPDLPTALAALRRREMVFGRESSRFQGPREYIFKHAMLRQVVYEGIVRRVRQRYHSLTADWLLAQAGDRAGEHAGLVAEHLELAARKSEAAVYFQAAAESAAARYANEEAIRYYRRVLALREALPEENFDVPTAVLLERLGDLYSWLTRHVEAREAYVQALARPEAQKSLLQARLLRKTANAFRDQYRYDDALQAYAEAERMLGEAPEKAADSSPDGAEASVRRWWHESIDTRLDKLQVLYWRDQADEAISELLAMRPGVERYGTVDQRTNFFLSLTAVHFRRDRMAPSETVRDYIRLAKAAAAASLPARDVPSTYFRLGFYSLLAGELAPAEEYISTGLRKAVHTGDISLQARCLTYLAMICRLEDRDEEVEGYTSRGLEVARVAGMPEYLGIARANQAWLAWRRGDLEGVEAHGRAALEMWALLPQGMASGVFQWTALWPLMAVALQRGQLADAVTWARALLQPTQMRLSPETEALLGRALEADAQHDLAQAQNLLGQTIASAERAGQL